MTTWLITGASSGLGAALARAVLHRGDNAVVTARNTEHLHDLTTAYPDTALAVPLEIGDHAQVVAAVDVATSRFGALTYW